MNGGAWIGTVVVTTVVTVTAMLAMAIGVAFGRRQPAGTCGGAAGDGCLCAPHGRRCKGQEETT